MAHEQVKHFTAMVRSAEAVCRSNRDASEASCGVASGGLTAVSSSCTRCARSATSARLPSPAPSLRAWWWCFSISVLRYSDTEGDLAARAQGIKQTQSFYKNLNLRMKKNGRARRINLPTSSTRFSTKRRSSSEEYTLDLSMVRRSKGDFGRAAAAPPPLLSFR